MGQLKLNIGCGNTPRPGYVNIDKYFPAADRVMDGGNLDYANHTVDEIFSSHMIEHVSPSEFLNMLATWKRVLKDKGRLVIRCPNHELHTTIWFNSDEKLKWSDKGLMPILGAQTKGPGYLNRNLFTVNKLKKLVQQAGFDIIRCEQYPSRTGEISNGDILCEAIKPRIPRST